MNPSNKKMLRLSIIGLLTTCFTGCSTAHFKPPQPAQEMWKPTPLSKVDVNVALKQCNFIDEMRVGVQKIQEQAQCMRGMGFEPDFSTYSPHNCYGNAPAGCIVYWPQGIAQPQRIEAQRNK